MKFKVGDKVKFLNESGGGVVSKIISPGMVSVAIEEGFDIPVMISEIIRIETEAPMDSPKHMFREDYDIAVDRTQENKTDNNSDFNIPLVNHPAKGVIQEGIYFAFVPQDQKWLITGLMDIYLLNHTPFDLLYSLFIERENGGYAGFDYGSVTPSSMHLLETTDREKIGLWEKGVIQVLFHKDRDNKILNPGNSTFRIRPSRFYQEGSYKDSAILEGKSMLISLLPLNAQSTLVQSDFQDKDTNVAPVMNESKEVEPEHIIDKHKTSPHEAVVDLHIGELVTDYRNLENAEILKIQVNYFIRCLENAIANELTKVTFIHGVGTGVLKTSIKQILKDYPNTEYRDASMQQFGYGAMDVIIR
jgi:hypothetical protein